MPLQLVNSWNSELEQGTDAGDGAPDEVSRLRAYTRQLEAVIESLPEGVALFDDRFRMILCNGQTRRILDYPDGFLDGGAPTMEDMFRYNANRADLGPGNVEMQVRRRMELMQQRRMHSYERERENGDVTLIRSIPVPGGGYVAVCQDVTRQRRDQALVEYMAQHDVLTGLPNRMLFSDRLRTAMSQVRRGGCMALHYLDLDRFKPVNDTWGHQAGDALLRQVAERLRSSVRESDTVARLGGDEFAIVQTGIERPEDAAVLAERILQVMAEPFDVAGTEVRFGMSIGISLAPADGSMSDDLLRKADLALYAAKNAGRNRYRFHTAETQVPTAPDSPPDGS